jgi:hypothetical protein
MLTGYNTDVRHLDLVLHVQTEDKGLDNPAIESVIYLRGRVLAAKRTAYEKLINQGKGEREIAAVMEHQHRTIVAAIRAGRFDGRIEQAIAAARGDGAAAGAAAPAAPVDPFHAEDGEGVPGERLDAIRATLLAEEHGPTLDQVILDYLSAEAEQEHLVLVLDGHDEIQAGRSNNLTLRAYSSKSGLPVAGVQVAVKMLSTVADPRTLLVAETDGVGSLEFSLDVPRFDRGSMALVISGASDLGRAEIKQLL